MTKYRKRPVVIEATQWLPVAIGRGKAEEMPVPPAPSDLLRQDRGNWFLKTLEGEYPLTPYDWIIQGVAREYYPCKPDIFELTYESVG